MFASRDIHPHEVEIRLADGDPDTHRSSDDSSLPLAVLEYRFY